MPRYKFVCCKCNRLQERYHNAEKCVHSDKCDGALKRYKPKSHCTIVAEDLVEEMVDKITTEFGDPEFQWACLDTAIEKLTEHQEAIDAGCPLK